MNLAENLVMQRCRPIGIKPEAANARPEDYFYTVVAAWLESRVFSSGDGTPIGYRLMCAVVSEDSGGTNVLPFLDLEFSDIE